MSHLPRRRTSEETSAYLEGLAAGVEIVARALERVDSPTEAVEDARKRVELVREAGIRAMMGQV